MPKRQKLPKIPDYIGKPKNGNLIVQKTNPLQSLSETDMTLTELKILDAYLSRIDSHAPEKRYVRFEKGELEQLLGVSRILKNDLSTRLDNLFTAVTIQDPDKPKGFIKIGLFSRAEAVQDKDGLWQINLACTEDAMEYIFNPEKLGYIKYSLKNVIYLTSRYSYVLYLYLKRNRWRKSWKISLDELKTMLQCNAERYTEYKFFNSEVLKKCRNELNKKTDLHYKYEPCDKKARRYTAVKFTIETQSDLPIMVEPQLKGQLSFGEIATAVDVDVDPETDWEEVYGSEDLAILAEACNYEFKKSDMEKIFCVLTRIDIERDSLTNSLIWGRQRYLAEKYAYFCSVSERKRMNGEKIYNRFSYFLSLLEKDTSVTETGNAK